MYNKKLIADLKNNLIVVVGSVSAIDKRKHLLNMGEESEECDDGPKGAKRKRGRGKGQQKGQAKKRGKGKKESEKRQDEELVRRSGRKRKLVDYTKMSGDDHDTDNATDNVDDSTEGSSGRPTCFGEYIRHKSTVSDDSGNDKDVWYTGCVVGVLDDDEYASDCEFQVSYDVDKGKDFTVVALMEDWKEGWV